MKFVEKRLQSASISDCNARGDDALGWRRDRLSTPIPPEAVPADTVAPVWFPASRRDQQQAARESSALLRVAALMHVA